MIPSVLLSKQIDGCGPLDPIERVAETASSKKGTALLNYRRQCFSDVKASP